MRAFFCAAFLLSCVVSFASADAANKPNIVYILVDNWGWGDISIQGSTVQTPKIDQLAREGLRLTNFNVENQCTPTRSAIHTGRLPIRSGTQKVPNPGDANGMAPWEYTIAEYLSDAGYNTALFGKWHIGDIDGRLPNDQGYDEWWGIKASAFDAAYTSTAQFDPKVYPVPYIWSGKKGEKSKKETPFDLENRGTTDRAIVEKTIAYIAAHARKDNPFYVYAAFSNIHPPFIAHPDIAGKSGAGVYADIQMEVDDHVGRILAAIKGAGIEDDTIVILSGDNAAGEDAGDGGSNGPWRGGLSTGYEGGIRTVGMIRWPGRIKPRVSDEIVASLDWYATLAHMIGESKRIPSDRPIDSIDQSKFILGEQEKSNREHVITYVGNEVYAVKWRTLKVHFITAASTFATIQRHTFPQVYDIKNDPDEKDELWQAQGFAHTWVMKPVMTVLGVKAISMKKFPNIQPGQDFKGYN